MHILRIQGHDEYRRGIHYEVDLDVPPLGEGGTGIVRQGSMVNDRTGDRHAVAIKFLYDDLNTNAIERSRREASIRISNENLIRMIDFVSIENTGIGGIPEKHYHVVSELLHGVMLSDIIEGKAEAGNTDGTQQLSPAVQRYNTDKVDFTFNVIRQILSAVQALHDYGYIHRDIDPTNIMITADGNVKLLDLGIAKRIDDLKAEENKLTKDGSFVGKASYAAPELALGDVAHQTKATDIYAIGILMYQMIVGELPFKGTIFEVLKMQSSSPMPLGNVKHKGIQKIIRKATDKDYKKRYQSAAEFRVALDSVDIRDSIKAPGKKYAMFLAAGILAAVLVAGAGTYVYNALSSGHDNKDIPAVVAVSAPGEKTAVENQETPITHHSPTAAQDHTDAKDENTASSHLPQTANENLQSVPVTVGNPASAGAPSPAASNPAPAPSRRKDAAKTASATPAASTSHISLSYGNYYGSIKNGYPNGKGKLVYSTSRRINRYDSKGIVAQPGEYVEGIFVNGFFTIGKHYSADGQVLNKISAGVADGVFESK